MMEKLFWYVYKESLWILFFIGKGGSFFLLIVKGFVHFLFFSFCSISFSFSIHYYKPRVLSYKVKRKISRVGSSFSVHRGIIASIKSACHTSVPAKKKIFTLSLPVPTYEYTIYSEINILIEILEPLSASQMWGARMASKACAKGSFMQPYIGKK